MLAAFTPQFFARVSGFGLETEQPVFIVGLPRSGTTLVEQILASHSQVFGAGELHYCDETFQLLPEAMNRHDTPLQCLLDLDRKTTAHLAEQHLDRLRALDRRAAADRRQNARELPVPRSYQDPLSPIAAHSLPPGPP